ncbi:hypothetical protein AAY473_016313 [Plecturocebus cupreus]
MGFHHVGQTGLKLLTLWSVHFGLPKHWDYREKNAFLIVEQGRLQGMQLCRKSRQSPADSEALGTQSCRASR